MKTKLQIRNLLEYAAKPLDRVRIGIVGLGNRGMKAVARYELVPGADIVALADHKETSTITANRILVQSGRPSANTYFGQKAHMNLMDDPSVNLVYLCTDWRSHFDLASMAMMRGKHVAIEVPAAMMVEECEKLIELSAQTGCHCVMLENCCYDTFASATRQMARLGLLGEITHCEGAYIHDLNLDVAKHGGEHKYWMSRETLLQHGNAYPTHSIGPIGLQMNLHRGDRMVSLMSLTSQGEGLRGRVNNTLIRTQLGRTILLQHDIGTPRPYSRLQVTCGTHGYTQKYPIPIVQTEGMDKALIGDEALELCQKYPEENITCWIEDGEKKNSSNVMNHVMDCRLVYCLQNGLPLDMDVFDAAEWSCIIELSDLSAARGGIPVEIPDFTQGNWQVLDGHKFY